jgi:hypothetical protein
VSLAPLSLHQKSEVQRLTYEGIRSGNTTLTQDGLLLALKASLKDIEGIEQADGSPYKLSFGEDKLLTDECLEDLCNISFHEKLILICTSLVRGIPDQEFKDEKGNKIEGVDIVRTSKEQETPN